MRSLAVYLKNYKKETILAPFFKFLEVVFDLMGSCCDRSYDRCGNCRK